MDNDEEYISNEAGLEYLCIAVIKSAVRDYERWKYDKKYERKCKEIEKFILNDNIYLYYLSLASGNTKHDSDEIADYIINKMK